ncbi:putative long-chain-fatty-acid--CoA ligase [Helianthus annuus]|nr:putative long-chain-fatty-acid--CoA ligase [Helianthus annuus]KAJ0519220.1 putative long-chain-fatty-acid--CoA ligase [Helianthus annuus]KAJ0687212.1 putative long-chain-fatty-acid--CoA ligase [Helianthus annuus]
MIYPDLLPDFLLISNVPYMQDVKMLIEDIGELKPTIFCVIPRVLERIYSGIFLLVTRFFCMILMLLLVTVSILC